MEIDGACLCGAIRYAATIDPARVGICHCVQCQTQSGAAFRAAVPVLRDRFRLLSGKPKEYVKTAESGNRRSLAFCGDCGTALYGASPTDPKWLSLRVGTARQRRDLAPTVQVWTVEALPWLSSLAGMPRIEGPPGRSADPSGGSAGPT